MSDRCRHVARAQFHLVGILLPALLLTSACDRLDASSVRLYDPDPKHLWNRLHEALFFPRGHGFHQGDPLWWVHRNNSDSRRVSDVIKVLDEFLESDGERLIKTPLKRALLQRDLWAVFDSVAVQHFATETPCSQELQRKLVRVMKRIALTDAEIEQLPDNYADAVAAKVFPQEPAEEAGQPGFLPSDLFQPDGPWVCIGAHDKLPLASRHVRSCDTSAVLLMFMQLPGGREPTLRHLEKLRDYSLQHPSRIPLGGPELPVGTRLALIRRGIGVSNQGKLVQTHLTDVAEFRVVRFKPGSLDAYEFTVNRPNLLAAKAGGFRAVPAGEASSVQFARISPLSCRENEFGKSPGKSRPVQFCMSCHSDGINGVQSYVRLLNPDRRVTLVETTPTDEAASIISSKQKLPEWPTFQKLWQSEPPPDK